MIGNLYFGVQSGTELIVAKSNMDIRIALKDTYRHYIKFPIIGITRKVNVIENYESYAIKLYTCGWFIPPIYIGQIFSTKSLPAELVGRHFKDAYGFTVTLETLDERYIDKTTEKARKELAILYEIRNKPKIFYLGDMSHEFFDYAKHNGIAVKGAVYVWKADDIITIFHHIGKIGISIPRHCSVQSFVDDVKDEIVKYNNVYLRALLDAMLNIEELADYASALLLLVDL